MASTKTPAQIAAEKKKKEARRKKRAKEADRMGLKGRERARYINTMGR